MDVSNLSLMQSTYQGKEHGPYVCSKCHSNFDGFHELSLHVKESCCKELEKNSNCIIYKGTKKVDAWQHKLSLSVNDYFYGEVDGSIKYGISPFKQKLSCCACAKLLKNNLRLMSHVRHKIENKWKENDNMCKICYRHHTSSLDLQSHIEAVHSDVPAATTCRICEINFAHGKLFLSHMQERHSYNELPYVCKVCSYRSSFYSDLTKHFRLNHENSIFLMCPFCLTVHNTANLFVAHVVQHMNNSTWCPRCRLQFLNEKDKIYHLKNDHQSILNVPNKRNLPKNLSDFMVHVEMSQDPSPPAKNGLTTPSTSPPSCEASSSAVIKSPSRHPWTRDLFLDGDIPMANKPLVRTSNIFVVLEFNSIKEKERKCLECGEKFGIYIADYNKHFRNEYRCCACPYRSHCYKATKRHILKNHVNQSQQGKLLDGALPSAVDEQASFTKETSKEAKNIEKSDVTGLAMVEPAKPAETSDDQIIFVGCSSIDRNESKTVEKKSILGKRKNMSINDLLFAKVEKENKQNGEAKSDAVVFKPTKQRRKQLKPQKVTLNEEEPDCSTHFDDSIRTTNPEIVVALKTDTGSTKTLKTPQASSTSEKLMLRSNWAEKNASLVRNRLIENFANQPGFDSNKKPASPKVTSRPRGPRKAQKQLQQKEHIAQAKHTKTTPKQKKTATPTGKRDTKQTEVIVQQQPSQSHVSTPAVENETPVKRPPVSFGSGVPTTQELSSSQTFVRLIGLRSNTHYLVRLCAVYKTFHSPYIAAMQRTLGLREKKEVAPVQVDDVITLDDDDDDVTEVSKPTFPPASSLTPTDQTSNQNDNDSNGPSIDLTITNGTEGTPVPSDEGQVAAVDSPVVVTSYETVAGAGEQLTSADSDEVASLVNSDKNSEILCDATEHLPAPTARTTISSSDPSGDIVASSPLGKNQVNVTKNVLEENLDQIENNHNESSAISTNMSGKSKENSTENFSVGSMRCLLKTNETANIAKSECKVIIKRLDQNALSTETDESVIIESATNVARDSLDEVPSANCRIKPDKTVLNKTDEARLTMENLDDLLVYLKESD